MTEKKKHETVTIKYDGGSVEVDLKKCRHCGKQPTAEEAQKAVDRERQRQKGCAVCGEKVALYPLAALWHSVDEEEGRAGWILCGTSSPPDPTWLPDWCQVSSYGPSKTVNAVFHIECLKKVAPGVEVVQR